MVISKLVRDSTGDKSRGAGNSHSHSQNVQLPEASTCDKHLYLPEYHTIEEVRLELESPGGVTGRWWVGSKLV